MCARWILLCGTAACGDNYLSRYEFAMSIANYFDLDNKLITSINTKELTKRMPSYTARRPKHSGLKTWKIEDEIGLPTYSTDYSLTILKNSFIAA